MAIPEPADRAPRFRRFGLGWQFRPPSAPVLMTFTSVSERRGELRCEIHVQNRAGGHMLRRYLNLLGSRSVDDLAKDLARADGGAAFPWSAILESAVESLIQAVRTGPPLETYRGPMQRPAGVRWLCEGLVMADVPNVWLAAGSTGKSTFSVALAVHHAIGESFLGRSTTKGVPLVLDWESTSDDFAEKVWLVSRWLGYSEVPTVHRLRMRGAASMHAAAIGNRIDELGATLVVWDGVQAAGGSPGQFATYETIALELESLVGLLPVTTHLLMDHVTGEELKSGAVPLKARGGTRKVEWARNQWTLVVDRDEQRAGRHVVGWTHTKINRGAFLPAFGVELLHRPDELGFAIVEEHHVKPLQERMPQWAQLLAVSRERGVMTNKQAAFAWLGADDQKSVDRVRAIVNRDLGRNFRRYSDGTFCARTGGPDSPAPAPNGPDGRHLRAVESSHEDEEELPF